MRCRSWRPITGTRHQAGHRPGACRACWKPCRARIEPGMDRCDDCGFALAEHPTQKVREAIAAVSTSESVLRLLGSDIADPVRATAVLRMRALADPRPARLNLPDLQPAGAGLTGPE